MQHLLKLIAVIAPVSEALLFCTLFRLAGTLGKLASSVEAACLPAWLNPCTEDKVLSWLGSSVAKEMVVCNVVAPAGLLRKLLTVETSYSQAIIELATSDLVGPPEGLGAAGAGAARFGVPEVAVPGVAVPGVAASGAAVVGADASRGAKKKLPKPSLLHCETSPPWTRTGSRTMKTLTESFIITDKLKVTVR